MLDSDLYEDAYRELVRGSGAHLRGHFGWGTNRACEGCRFELRERLNETLSVVKIHLVANTHPLQVDPGIGFLCTLEGLEFVSGISFPHSPLVGSRPTLSSRA